jgi:hypothetical protein
VIGGDVAEALDAARDAWNSSPTDGSHADAIATALVAIAEGIVYLGEQVEGLRADLRRPRPA